LTKSDIEVISLRHHSTPGGDRMNTLVSGSGGWCIAGGVGAGMALGIVVGYGSLGLALGFALGVAAALLRRR
jgi:hypothetical protein